MNTVFPIVAVAIVLNMQVISDIAGAQSEPFDSNLAPDGKRSVDLCDASDGSGEKRIYVTDTSTHRRTFLLTIPVVEQFQDCLFAKNHSPIAITIGNRSLGTFLHLFEEGK